MSTAMPDGGFDFDTRIGIYFSVQFAFLSAAAVSVLLVHALVRWLKRMKFLRRGSMLVQADVTDSSLFLNLMLADLLQAVGNMPSIKWMREGRITLGSVCTAQAVIKQVGINGVALTSLAIAVHTFSILILRWRAPRHIAKFMVAGVWAFTALVVGIPYAIRRDHLYYGDTGFWCWIVPEWRTEQIVSEYAWVWTAAIAMVVLYGIMFLVMRGFMKVGNSLHFQASQRRQRRSAGGKEEDISESESDDEEEEMRAMANMLLFYPAVYIFCVLPNTITRWLYFDGHEIPAQASLFGSALFACSGLFNVILFFLTRPELVKGPSSAREPSNAAAATGGGATHSKYGNLPRRDGPLHKSAVNDSEKVGSGDGFVSSGHHTNSNNGRVFVETDLYQSPPGRGTLSLPPVTQNDGQPAQSPPLVAGPYTNSTVGAGHPRSRTAAARRDEDSEEEEEDWGRLPV